MGKSLKKGIKRTQRDYSLGFKLSLISRVEAGEFTYKEALKQYGIQGTSTVLVWLRKYGTQDWNKPKRHLYLSKMKETPAQKIKRLERELADEKLKNRLLNRMIDISDEQEGTSIRKKYHTQQSEAFNKKKK